MTKTYDLPNSAIQPMAAKMARGGGLRVVKQSAAVITVEGSEDDHAIFATRLAILNRLCG